MFFNEVISGGGIPSMCVELLRVKYIDFLYQLQT